MNNQEPNNSIHEQVLKAIESGEVKMRPKWHFVLKSALFFVGGLLLALTLVYLVSFTIFVLRQTGVLFIPGFGPHGLNVFLISAPWLLILMSLIFIALLQILVIKYSIGYGRPLLYSAIVILLLAILGGALVDRTSFHRKLFRRAENQRLPFAGVFYKRFGESRPDNVTIGSVSGLISQGYEIDDRGEDIFVIVTPHTFLPDKQIFSINDMIIVFGNRQDATVTAEGIRIFSGEEMPHRIMMPPMPPGFQN